MASLLHAIRSIAEDAGRLILEHYARPFRVDFKADDSPLTDADRASHALIVTRLAELTPDVPILSEEGEPEAADRAGWTRFWCVDPLDGTKEFVKRTGEFTVNIALVDAGAPVLGVVHIPVMGRTYFAARGEGAWCADDAGAPAAIRTRPADPLRLTVVASRDHAGPEVAAIIAAMEAGSVEVTSASMGSALKFCLVAEGVADFYPRTGPTMEWDTAAAQAIVEAAGGAVTTLDGRQLGYNKASLRNPPIVTAGDPALDWRPYLGQRRDARLARIRKGIVFRIPVPYPAVKSTESGEKEPHARQASRQVDPPRRNVMATPHPGKWELVLTTANCQLSTTDPAVHAAVVANRNTGAWKVLYWRGRGLYRSFLWDPTAPGQQSAQQTYDPWPGQDFGPADFFCSGHAHMEDGRLLVAGGHRPPSACAKNPPRGLPYAYFFDPLTEAWSTAGTTQNPHAMADGRWYPTLTTLGEGPPGEGYREVLAISGLRSELDDCDYVVNTDPEIYNPATGWRLMARPAEAVQPFGSLYPGGHVIPFGSRAGKVFYSMPMEQAYAFDPFAPDPPVNGGYWTAVGSPRATPRGDGASVLLPLLPGATTAKVLILGGGPEGQPATKTADVLDAAGAGSSTPWTQAAPMFHARKNMNAVLLPDDTVLVVGGNLSGGQTDPVFTAEAYDPATDAWRLLPAMNRMRVYHSTAVLLPDGKVWASGTFADADYAEANVELYSPGYLFEGARPVITSAPSVVHYGTTFSINTSVAIGAIRLIRLGVATHSTNMDQRSVGLAFVQTNPNNGPTWSVTAPANANVAPPGLYMLFVLRPKAASLSGQSAIPSVARIVNVRRPLTP